MFRPVLLIAAFFLSCATATSPYQVTDPSTCQETYVPEYDRSLWKHWSDEDGDCQDSRQEVLIRDSLEPVVFKTEKQCHVVSGKWIDPYTGTVVLEASLVDVDHIVALKDAHDSGGYAWGRTKKEDYANDLDNLTVSSRSSNRSKGSKGPDEWLPPLESYRCDYIEKWESVKMTWALSKSAQETAVLSYMRKTCQEGKVPFLPQN